VPDPYFGRCRAGAHGLQSNAAPADRGVAMCRTTLLKNYLGLAEKAGAEVFR